MQLVLDDECAVPLPMDEVAREAWVLQRGRAATPESVERLHQRLAACFAASMAECLDTDLKPPSDAQIRYGMAIAKELGIALPAEALRYRGAMAEYISRFAESHKAWRARWRPTPVDDSADGEHSAAT